MAIAPSKLGLFLRSVLWSAETDVLEKLRGADLLRPDAPDHEVRAAIRATQKAHGSVTGSPRFEGRSPEERARVFLQPYLSAKGLRWAVPVESLRLPDD